MSKIHPSSVIGPDVELADDVEIGPYCSLEGRISIGSGCKVQGHCYLTGPLTIGVENRFYPFACVGFEPQDYKFDADRPNAGVRIGDRNLFREKVTIHRATSDHAPTTIGDQCMFMVGAHIGHDATVGNRCVLVNGVALGGHAIVDDQVTIGGGTHIAQRRRVGRLAFIGGNLGVAQHFPPFMLMRTRNLVAGVNVVGLRRAGLPHEEIDLVRWAFRVIYEHRHTRPAVIEELCTRIKGSTVISTMVDFLKHVDGPVSKAERYEHVDIPDEGVLPPAPSD
jgi:UDP-N-acetylglucosamine acyltransferase